MPDQPADVQSARHKRPWRTPRIQRLRTHVWAAGTGTAAEGAKVPSNSEGSTIRLAAILYGGPS